MSKSKKVYDLAVVTRVYVDAQGVERKTWAQIGSMMESSDGKPFLLLDRHINLAGIPTKDGASAVLVSCFVPGDREERQGRKPKAVDSAPVDPNDIPF